MADERNLGAGGMEADPGASAEAGRAVGQIKVNNRAAIDSSAFKELNSEFKALQGYVNTFKRDLPNLIKGTRDWANELSKVAKNMKGVTGGAGGGGNYLPNAGTLTGSGNTASNTQVVNVFQGGAGGGTDNAPSAKGMAADLAKQIIGAIGQAVDARISRGASYSLSADRMNMLYQQMSGMNQNQTYKAFRQPLQGYRLGMGGINEVLGLQASTGLNAQAQARSIDAMRASSGYAYSTSDLVNMTRQMARPEATNMMFMTMGTGMYGIGGSQRTQQQVFQDIIKRSGLTSERAIKGAMQQGSTVRARLEMSGLTEDQINPLLQYAQQNVAYARKGGRGFYDPSQKSQRELMGVEGNYASQAEETERVKAVREENFYKRQNDNFAQMEKNIQAVNQALQAFEEKLSGIVGARISTKASIAKGVLKFGAAGAAGIAGAVAGGGFNPVTGFAAFMGTKSVLDAALGDGYTSTEGGGGNGGGGTPGGTNVENINNKPGSVPPNVRKSEKYLSRLNPQFAARVRKMLEANPRLYIGGGSRTSAEQRNLFLSRYEETTEQTDIKWNGKYWKKKNPNVPDAAPPGVSMHEIGMAADIHGDDDFLNKHASEFGLMNFARVNNEPWHVQPKEFTKGQWEYRQAGAPWGLNGAGSADKDWDPNTEFKGATGSQLSSVTAKYSHSSGSGSVASSSSSGGYQWAGMSMSEIVGTSRTGDGMWPSKTSGNTSLARSMSSGTTGPMALSLSPSAATLVSGPEYNVTIAPNITIQSSGAVSTDAHKIAKEVSALLDREVKMTLMRNS